MGDFIMRTTLNLDDQLLKLAKHRAIEQGVSLSEFIENVIRQSFSRQSVDHKTVRLITTAGPGVKPGVDLDNARSMLDIMDDLV